MSFKILIWVCFGLPWSFPLFKCVYSRSGLHDFWDNHVLGEGEFFQHFIFRSSWLPHDHVLTGFPHPGIKTRRIYVEIATLRSWRFILGINWPSRSRTFKNILFISAVTRSFFFFSFFASSDRLHSFWNLIWNYRDCSCKAGPSDGDQLLTLPR